MKKTILLIAILISAVAMCYTSFAQNPPSNPPTRTLTNLITFFRKPATSKPRPRSAVFVPITGTYDYSSQCIRLDFLDNVGEMTITVINHTTGEQAFEYADASFESTEVYISGSEGEYSIVIEAQDSSSFYAEFSIL